MKDQFSQIAEHMIVFLHRGMCALVLCFALPDR